MLNGTMAPNPKLKGDDGFERRTENSDNDSERRNRGSECRSEKPMMALSAELKSDNDGSERQN